MKNSKIYKLMSVLLISILFLTSCNEDPIYVSSSFDGNGLKVITYNNGKNGKTAATPIAVFTDQQTYNTYIEGLDAQVEAWDDAFVAQWGYLDDDALNDKEEALGFDSEKPLTDFENQIGLQSLRQKYLAEEEIWLNNEVLNDALDPDNKPEFDFDNEEMTVLNTLSEVQIGTQIYKKLNSSQIEAINNNIKSGAVHLKSAQLLESGAGLIITNSDYNTLIDFNNGNTSVINNNNVVVTTSNSRVNCSTGKLKRTKVQLTSDRLVKVLIKVRAPFANWNGKVKSKLKSYRKKRHRWRKYRATISAGVVGKVWDSNCGAPFLLNKKKEKRRKKKVKYSYRDQYQNGGFFVENGGMKGVYSQNGIETELILTW